MTLKIRGFIAAPNIRALLVAYILFVFSSGALAQSMSLNDAILKALKNDPVIQKIHADALQADGFAIEVRSERRPHLTLNGDMGYGYRSRSIGGLARGGRDLFDRRAGLIVEQLIWDNKSSCYRWKDAKFRRKAAVLLDKAQRETTAIGIVEAYLNVLRTRDQIKLARQNYATHKKFHQLAKERVNGVGNKADVELAYARLHLAQTLVEERELELKQAEASFVRYAGVEPPALNSPKYITIDSADEIDPTRNFHYQATLHQCKAAQLANAAICRSRGPRVLTRGSGSYGVDILGIEGEDKDISALLVMQWDLVEGGRKKGLLRQAEGDIARQVAIVKETKVLLERDIRTRWADYSTLGERIEILERYTKGLTETVSLYRKQFELNKRPLLGVLDIENEKISSEIRLVDERFERSLNSYRLLFYCGRLVRSTVGLCHLECDIHCLDLNCPETENLTSEAECIKKPVPVARAVAVGTPLPSVATIDQGTPVAHNDSNLKDLLMLAAADGRIDPEEQKAISAIGKKMGISESQIMAVYRENVIMPSEDPIPSILPVKSRSTSRPELSIVSSPGTPPATAFLGPGSASLFPDESPGADAPLELPTSRRETQWKFNWKRNRSKVAEQRVQPTANGLRAVPVEPAPGDTSYEYSINPVPVSLPPFRESPQKPASPAVDSVDAISVETSETGTATEPDSIVDIPVENSTEPASGEEKKPSLLNWLRSLQGDNSSTKRTVPGTTEKTGELPELTPVAAPEPEIPSASAVRIKSASAMVLPNSNNPGIWKNARSDFGNPEDLVSSTDRDAEPEPSVRSSKRKPSLMNWLHKNNATRAAVREPEIQIDPENDFIPEPDQAAAAEPVPVSRKSELSPVSRKETRWKLKWKRRGPVRNIPEESPATNTLQARPVLVATVVSTGIE